MSKDPTYFNFHPFSERVLVKYLLGGLDEMDRKLIEQQAEDNSEFKLVLTGLQMSINHLLDLEIVENIQENTELQAEAIIAHFNQQQQAAATKIFGQQTSSIPLPIVKEHYSKKNGRHYTAQKHPTITASSNKNPITTRLKKRGKELIVFLETRLLSRPRFALPLVIFGIILGIAVNFQFPPSNTNKGKFEKTLLHDSTAPHSKQKQSEKALKRSESNCSRLRTQNIRLDKATTEEFQPTSEEHKPYFSDQCPSKTGGAGGGPTKPLQA